MNKLVIVLLLVVIALLSLLLIHTTVGFSFLTSQNQESEAYFDSDVSLVKEDEIDEPDDDYPYEEESDYYDDGTLPYDKDCQYDMSEANLFELSEEALLDTLKVAFKRARKYHKIANHSFLYYYSSGGYLSSVYIEEIENIEYSSYRVAHEVPLEERRFRGHDSDYTVSAYDVVVKTLSQKRDEINFVEFYDKYKWIIQQIVSKEDYNREYAPSVDILLLAYNELENDPIKRDHVKVTMEQHWMKTLENDNVELSDCYSLLEKYLNESSLEHINKYIKNESNQYTAKAFVVWAYSFWLRRKAEGKDQQVYDVLTKFKADFASED